MTAMAPQQQPQRSPSSRDRGGQSAQPAWQTRTVTAATTAIAAVVTSGPIPSPGIRAICIREISGSQDVRILGFDEYVPKNPHILDPKILRS